MPNRILFFDVLKFVAICCVCIGHVCIMFQNGYKSSLHQIIYSFHMPLFMMICGFFSINSYKISFGTFLKKKAIQLLLPTISFSLLTGVVCLFISDNGIGVLQSELIGGMWFLRVLFFCYVVVYCFKRTGLPDWASFLISSTLFFVIPYGGFLRANYSLVMFWLGYFINKYYSIYESLQITIISTLFMVCFGIIGESPKIELMTIVNNPYILPKYILSGFFDSVSIMGIIYYVCKYFTTKATNYLGTIGKYTLGIYGIHSMFINILRQKFIINIDMLNIFNNVYCIIGGIILCYATYITVLILNKNKYCSLLLFGNMYKK